MVLEAIAHAVGDGLQHHRLAGLGLRHDQGALPLPEGTEQINDPGGVVRLALADQLALQAERLIGVHRGELLEVGPLAKLAGGAAVDRVDLVERAATLPVPDLAADLVAGAEAELADEAVLDADVTAQGEVTRLAAGEG